MENMHTDFWVMISNRKETPYVQYCPFRFWELINLIRNHFITDVRDDPTTFKFKSLYPQKRTRNRPIIVPIKHNTVIKKTTAGQSIIS